MSDIIKKLPSVFQTTAQKKFFDATFDQAFSKKETEYIAGYIGRRLPGSHHPISDFYKPEPTKNRARWQLEPAAISRDKDFEKSNAFFYEDLLDKIKFYGGNVGNQDRLFNSEYYSWAPPIDFDMFINYQSYYWLTKPLPAITLYNTLAVDIIGKKSVLISGDKNSSNQEFLLSTGMVIKFRDDPQYIGSYIVDFTNRGIVLTDNSDLLQSESATISYHFLPWDGTISLQDGTTINNALWDTKTWEIEPHPASSDYTVIQRGDRNMWSINNQWVHIDVINRVLELTGEAFPAGASRALRPIIQFDSGLILYKSGTQFKSTVKYGFGVKGGLPVSVSDFNFKSVSDIYDEFGIEIKDNDTIIFLNDESELIPKKPNNREIYIVDVTNSEIIKLKSYKSIISGDTVRFLQSTIDGSPEANQSWYFDVDKWVRAYNDKEYINQPPLFALFDHTGAPLDDAGKYPGSTFAGSKIFSYRLDTEPGAVVDPVLRIPILYTSVGQSSDIVFENNLITNRYHYNDQLNDIAGYYYYSYANDSILRNGWELFQSNSLDSKDNLSKQRVIDQYVVGYNAGLQFPLSVLPSNYPLYNNIIVTVNGIEVKPKEAYEFGFEYYPNPPGKINNRVYIDLTSYLENVYIDKKIPIVVEIQTFTEDLLDDNLPGFFEIPAQLDANPNQAEVGIVNGSDLINHFASIIQNQQGFDGIPFGGSNNYRDTGKNKSLGKYILQTVTPLLKPMLVSSDESVDLIPSIRFSQNEYTSFKNRYIKTAKQLIDQNFDPLEYFNGTVKINQWVDTILKTINISREFSSAFANSYMIPSGEPYATETYVLDSKDTIQLKNYVDLTDVRNSVMVYDISGEVDKLLVIGFDYEIVSKNNLIEIEPKPHILCQRIAVVLYQNPTPAYVPSTPTKLGMYGAYIPRMELDTGYAQETYVIIGHDGSRTVAYGDYRDKLILELERRIYNQIQLKYRHEYNLPIPIESIKPGYFRKTRYSREEYLNLIESHLNKWSTKNRANYRLNEFHVLKDQVSDKDAWKLVNYTRALRIDGSPANLPGHWRGIFNYYFDTVRPNTAPWEMLGFSIKPEWWETEYGNGIINDLGQVVWTSKHTRMWRDLELGIIRRGPRSVYNHITLEPKRIEHWARPGLNQIIPVDELGNIIPVPVLFNLLVTGDAYEPFDGYDDEWKIGDVAPVEYAWMCTSEYTYSLQEISFLARPAAFGELNWDTLGTELSPGYATLQDVGTVKLDVGYQYVQNDQYFPNDPMIAWTRPKNSSQRVHSEIVDGIPQIRFGYQTWISDRIQYLGRDVTDVFGVKVRNLSVNLANKLAGFTNKDTVNTYIESVGLNSLTSTLGIPSENFDVILHQSPPVDRYSYSGVIIRTIGDGKFAVYGYDLLDSQFTILERSDEQAINISVGGTPVGWRPFSAGDTYYPGDIVKYNGIYYSSIATHSPIKFVLNDWDRLAALPIDGGISVTYKPRTTDTIIKYQYGHTFNSIQEVFDFLIGYGDFLERQGWQFTDIDPTTSETSDWLLSAKQFLYWVNTQWAPDQSIQLSPLANNATLTVKRGYPDNVESVSNGVYSILDRYGVSIPVKSTTTERNNQTISIKPSNDSVGGIYFVQVTASETEHILLFDNVTSFGDIVYSPLLRARQSRIRYNGFRSLNWYGKKEAPGSFIIGNQLVPNYNTIVENMRYYYDPDILLDDPNMEDLGRRLIGYETKAYLDNLQVSHDVQYLFYQGTIRQKGTEPAINRLFRSSAIQSNDAVKIYEEWALKSSEFGNSLNQVSTEFILDPEQQTGEAIVARLNYINSHKGRVKKIEILNAETRYDKQPELIISDPPEGFDASLIEEFVPGQEYNIGSRVYYRNYKGEVAYYESLKVQNDLDFISNNWKVLEQHRPAQAHALLDSNNRIVKVELTDPGYGYSDAPHIEIIDSNGNANTVDQLYAVWVGESVRDATLDNIIDIDIDDDSIWVRRPKEPELSLVMPTTDRIDYDLPNAGYVNFKDVDWYSFDVESSAVSWGSESFNPIERDTVWIAKTFNEGWDVFKLVKLDESWKIITDENDNILLLTNSSLVIGSQYSTSNIRTDFGNMIVLQSQSDDSTKPVINVSVGLSLLSTNYTDPDNNQQVTAYSFVNLQNTPLTSEEIVGYDLIDTILLFKTLRYPTTPAKNKIPIYAGVGDYIWVDDHNGKWTVFRLDVDPGYWDIYLWDIKLGQYWGVSSSGDYSDLNYGWDAFGPMKLSVHREQEPLIDTSLFENAQIFNGQYGEMLAQLPIYDPFKGILPGEAKKNLTYITPNDPARYNVASSERLKAKKSLLFGQSQVGQLWWDTSSIRYVYYEQPAAKDVTVETSFESLAYRRDLWGTLFPGSSVDIYEWIESEVPPIDYAGTGVVKSLDDYIVETTPSKITGLDTTLYYFWVKNRTSKPNLLNRTMSGLDVAIMLNSPRSQFYSFFSPIQQSIIDNAYVFFNISNILSSKGNNVRINFKNNASGTNPHTQWSLFREGDPLSEVPKMYWDKMVDSLCGYTKETLPSDNTNNPIRIQRNGVLVETFAVPDPKLSLYERTGVSYRPRQTMFVDVYQARKVFVQCANRVLKQVSAKDSATSWNQYLPQTQYETPIWKFENWFKDDSYRLRKPNFSFDTLIEAKRNVDSGVVPIGSLVRVAQGTINGKFVIYEIKYTPSIDPRRSDEIFFEEVIIEEATIQLRESVFTSRNQYRLSTDLRQILDILGERIFVGENSHLKNQLFSGMLNYILSEQSVPDWVFKTSLVKVKESTVALEQTNVLLPDQTSSVLQYIADVKPYHTQISLYSSEYSTKDLSDGTASDLHKTKVTLKFDPGSSPLTQAGWDTFAWDSEVSWDGEWPEPEELTPDVPVQWDYALWDGALKWDGIWTKPVASRNRVEGNTEKANSGRFGSNPLLICNGDIEQFISREDVYTVTQLKYAPELSGDTGRYPYIIDFRTINQSAPKYTPASTDTVAILHKGQFLYNGEDFYVEYIGDDVYAAYLKVNPNESELESFIWFDGNLFDSGFDGAVQRVEGNTQLRHSGIFGINQLLTCNGDIEQFASNEHVYTVRKLKYAPELAGDTGRYPYIIDFGKLHRNSPQYNPAPTDTVAILHDGKFLYNGVDFYVEYIGNDVYVAYLKDNPCVALLEAFIWFDGSSFDLDLSQPTALLEGNTQEPGTGIFGINPLLTVNVDIDQFISQESVYTVDDLVYREDLKGYSNLYPYLVSFKQLHINSPQKQTPIGSIVGILKDDAPLINGRDFFVKHISGDDYVAYLFNDPGVSKLQALIWVDGGSLTVITQPNYRSEIALGSVYDSNIISVRTKLPLVSVGGKYVVPVGSGYINPDSVLGQVILSSGGTLDPTWDWRTSTDWQLTYSDAELKYTQHVVDSGAKRFFRNGKSLRGTLVNALTSPTEQSTYLDVIRVEIDPNSVLGINQSESTDGANGNGVVWDNVWPEGPDETGVIWINSERFEYKSKTKVAPNTWDLKLVLRGSRQTTPIAHQSGSLVYIEKYNAMAPSGSSRFWSATGESVPDTASGVESEPGKYTSISNPSRLGIWYSGTSEANFLKADPGQI